MKKFETKWNELYESQRNMQLKRRFSKWGKQNQKSKRKKRKLQALAELNGTANKRKKG